MRIVVFLAVSLSSFACSSDDDPGDAGMTPADASAVADAGPACASISCYVASENLCDDYTQATTTQCADVPTACATRGGVAAGPAACPTADFQAKCSMPGPGAYVLRFYGTRGDANDQSFCTGAGGGSWSTTF